MLFAWPGISFGQEESTSTLSLFEQYQVEIVLALAVLVCIVAIMAMYVMLVAMKTIMKAKQAELGVETDDGGLITVREGEEGAGFWRRFWNRMNDSVPVSREAEVATDHEYDGIRELDNRLPPWWLYGFYFTIIFGVIYIINYHILKTTPLQHEEFQAEMIKAEEDVQIYLASLDNLIDETNVELLTESVDLASGEALYQKNCAVCHAADGGGGVGPNFTDKYWLHGGGIKDIFKTIKYGVPSKGMIAWETQLSPKDMQSVASYIYMMEGNTSENPKDPQGDLFERVESGDEVEENNSSVDSTHVGDAVAIN